MTDTVITSVANNHFVIETHPQHPRVNRLSLSADVIAAFLEVSRGFTVTSLEYVPFMRFVIAERLKTIMGDEFVETLRSLLRDRNTGALTLGLTGYSEDTDEFVRFATAVTHLIGIPNHDAMTGNYYARFIVEHTDNSDSYLRKAYTPLSLHTDGTYVDESTDWLLMMKMVERNVKGGRTRLLHLDDWEQLDRFSEDEMASQLFTYKAPPSKNVKDPVFRQTFFPDEQGKPCLCFIDQFVYPETREQAVYLHDLLDAMETSPATKQIELPVGELILLNNTFWVHGREAFQPNDGLFRELMRQRGRFAET